MTSRILLAGIIVCLLNAGCSNRDREEQLARREQALLEKERQFALKEADYQSLKRMRDSLLRRSGTLPQQPDTLKAGVSWPRGIAGRWKSKVICRESDCPGYVIGDQRSDTWEFVADSTGRFARVLDKEKLIRVFTGGMDGGKILLDLRDGSSAPKEVQLNVVLSPVNAGLITGTQVISIDQCSATFSVELARISN